VFRRRAGVFCSLRRFTVLCGAEVVNMADHGRYGGPRFAQLDEDYKV